MRYLLLAAALAAFALPAAAQDCEEGQTLFVHDMIVGGSICLPVDPRRVLFSGDVGPIALALGAEPIGYDRYTQMFSDVYPGVLDSAQLDGVPYVGFLPRDDLETVAATQPDMIVSESYWPDLNDNLAKIAPTVVVATESANAWRVREEAVAAILGREAESDRLLAELDARLARVSTFLGDEPPTFAIAQATREEGILSMHTSAGFGAQIMEGLGMVQAPGVLSPDDSIALGGNTWNYDLSVERVEDLAATYIFALPSWGDDPMMGIFDGPLWSSSPALADATLVRVEGTPRAFVGEYALNAHALIDLVYREVLGLDPQEVDPNPFADWLPQSRIPSRRPTMRLILTAALAALALPAAAQHCADGTRAFEHYAGTTCVPKNPQRIVTLQDQNALLPLLELGVVPVASVGHVLEDDGTVFRRTQNYDTSEIAFLGSYRGPTDREAVAALQPDLIVAAPWPDGAYEQFSPVAPTVVIDMFDQPLADALMQFADLVGKTERAEALGAAFDAAAEETVAALGDRLEDTTVSVGIYDGAEERFYAVNEVQAWQMLFEALPFPRPAPEEALGTDREYRSMEVIGEHAADVMILVTFSGDQNIFDANFEEFIGHPLVRTLPVAQAGQIVKVNGAEVLGAAWEKPTAGLAAFSEILLRDDLNRDLVAE